MNCQELHQDIQELVEKRQELVEALDDATSSGWGRNKIEGICDEHERKSDATLEKYLPDFRERFPELSKMELAGKLKSIITGSKVTTLWGGTVVVSTSFVSSPVAQSIIENPDGSLSAGEKIETFKPKFDDDFVEISDDRCLVVSNRIGVGIVVKDGNTFTHLGDISGNPVGPILGLKTLNNHEWTVWGAYGVCVLTENENGEFSFGGEKKWKTEDLFPKQVYPLGDEAILVTEGEEVTCVLSRGQNDNNFREVDTSIRGLRIYDIVNVSDDKWIVEKKDRGLSEWAVLVNNGGKYEKCNEFRMVDGFTARHINHLSGNDVLVDLEGRGFFIYTMNSDGTLTRGRDIGYDYPSGSKLEKVIPIDEHRWLLNIDVSDNPNSDLAMECESFVVHERGPGKYELAERIDGLFYPVHSLASLPGGRFLVDSGTFAFTTGRSVDFRGNVIDDPLSRSDERDVLGAVSFIDDVESLKKYLDRIIESGNWITL